ncbi:MAG: T9SS C-terminal target domain-containing protein [Deltaproteobacteria bacterium]|nr:MAG: T9SS C-terminal target domain-containing protein [Deltaproteobacteria bacterium]
MVLQPNPASDQVLIRLQDAPTGPWGWTLMGADGKVWRRGSFDDAEWGYQYLMSTSDLPAGLYLLRVQTAEQALVRKLLVQH